MNTTLFVTLALTDANRWTDVHAHATRLGALAAVLQGVGPNLVEQLDAAVKAGFTSLTVVGVTFSDGVTSTIWAERVIRWWIAQHPQAKVDITLMPEPFHSLPEAIPTEGGRLLRPLADGVTNPAWDQLPPIHTQVLACRGPRCLARGSDQIITALSEEMERRGIRSNGVLLTQTGCLYPCNHAPVMAIQPHMLWVGPVTLQLVSSLVGAIVTDDYTALPRVSMRN